MELFLSRLNTSGQEFLARFMQGNFFGYDAVSSDCNFTDFSSDENNENAASDKSSHASSGEETAVAGYNVTLRKKYRKR